MIHLIVRLAAWALILGALAIFPASSVRAGPFSLGSGSVGNRTNFNELDLSTNTSTRVDPVSVSQVNQPSGLYSLTTQTSYSDNFISSSGPVQSGMTSQLNSPQIVQSTSANLSASTLTSGWFNKSFLASNDFQSFTLTAPAFYTLHEQATVSTNSELSIVAGSIQGPSGVVTSWSLSAVGSVPMTTDTTVTGLLGPGNYLLSFGSEVGSYAGFGQQFISNSEASGQQTLRLSPTPEPSSFGLASLAAGISCGIIWLRRRKSTVK
jgi:hypothetical protein